MSDRILLHLSIDDDWDRVEPVREAVASCVRAAYGSEEMSDALSMVASELLENAVKYGRPGALIRFDLDEHEELTITVSNAVEEGSPHLGKLRERVDWVRSFADPAEAYLATMAEVYQTGNLKDGSSCLGILRIAHEGQCAISLESPSPDTISVQARYRGNR
jgi:hypothetical protein